MNEITDEQIEALQREAGEAGDDAQVALCERALSDEDDDEAWDACRAAIRNARAMV